MVFGMGGGLLQQCNRDTFQFAQKCSSREMNGNQWVDTFKDPVGDTGKTSLRGRVTLVQNTKTKAFRTIRLTDPIKDDEVNVMRTIYHNGVVEAEFQTFDEIREESEKYLDYS